MKQPLVLTIDIGSSSLRVNVFDSAARRLREFEAKAEYETRTTREGGMEVEPSHLAEMLFAAVDETLAKLGDMTASIEGVGCCSLVSNVLGLNAQDEPTTPIYTWADTRCAPQVEALRTALDEAEVYERTGCPLHTSYLPARLVWLREEIPEAYGRTMCWGSLGEYVFGRLFGRYGQSLSVASWAGLLNRRTLDWDDWLLGLIGVERRHLPRLVDAYDGFKGLMPEFAGRWPALKDAVWFPFMGDGVASNLGSGCYSQDEWAVQVGTSSAMRAFVAGGVESVPRGLWCYQLDSETALLGGALSEGGNVFAWLRETLKGDFGELEREAAGLPPDGHGLTVLPFIAGERSPGWNASARMVIEGITAATRPAEIVRACQEAIAYRLAAVYELMKGALGEPKRIVASGGALLNTPGWVQMLADVLGQAVTVSGEEEASSKGAAMLAMLGSGRIGGYEEIEGSFGEVFEPDMGRYEVYRRGRERQGELYRR